MRAIFLPQKGEGPPRSITCEGTLAAITKLVSGEEGQKKNIARLTLDSLGLLGKKIVLYHDKTAKVDQLIANRLTHTDVEIKGNVLVYSPSGDVDINTIKKIVKMSKQYGIFALEVKQRLSVYAKKKTTKYGHRMSRREIFAIVKEISNKYEHLPHDSITWDSFNNAGGEIFTKLGL